MDLDDIDDDTLDQLADRLAARLDPGAYGDRVVLSRRQLVGVATGVLGTGALMRLGVDPAAAQAAGSVGTSSDPVDVFAYDLDVQNGVSMNGNDITGAGSVSTDDIDIIDSLSFTATTETISSGSIPYSGVIIEVNGAGGSADRLDELTNATDGDLVVLRRGDADITVTHNSGSNNSFILDGASDKTLAGIYDMIVCIYDDDGRWVEV